MDSRIIVARFEARPFSISIVQVYAPTAESSEEEIDLFYTDLIVTIREILKRDVMIIGEDWNAKIGR